MQPFYKDGWFNPVLHEDYDALNAKVKDYGFDSVEQLIRWRCSNETGGGLMAELGSHQLDACSIFLGHVHPLAVTGVGGKYFYGRPPASGETNDYGFQTNFNDRDSDDHVFLTYEFPGKNHPRGRQHRAATRRHRRGHLYVDQHQRLRGLRRVRDGHARHDDRGEGSQRHALPGEEPGPERRPGRRQGDDGDGGRQGIGQAGAGLVLDVGAGGQLRSAGAGPVGGSAGGVVSRGYQEEIEDFAFCVRQWQKGQEYYKQRLPRCHGEVAMVDAIIALTANQAMRGTKKNGNQPERIEFEEAWFDPKATDGAGRRHETEDRGVTGATPSAATRSGARGAERIPFASRLNGFLRSRYGSFFSAAGAKS